jgi:hypothetical protein
VIVIPLWDNGFVLDQLAADLEELTQLDPRVLADSSSVERLQGLLSQLEAVTCRAVAAWDADRGWAADGAKNATAWLSMRCRLPRTTAARRLRLGRACRDLPAAGQAWLDGRVDSAHVAALARARNERTVGFMARDEVELVGNACSMSFKHFRRVLAYWEQHADPDGVEADAQRQVDARCLNLDRTFAEAWLLSGLLDPVRGSVVNNMLQAIEHELFLADWNDARQRLGRDPAVHELARTSTQRRADALVEMAMRAGTNPKDGRRPMILLSVLVGYETFAGRICQLADNTAITPGSLLPWLTEAHVERVVFDSPSRIIDIGQKRRLFTGATRRLIEIRDRECIDELCEEPAGRCQADHTQPWSHGGPTTHTNGKLRCGHHNRLRWNQRDDDDEPP